MGLIKFIGSLFTKGNSDTQDAPDVHPNVLTPDSFTPNQEYLYTSSLLTREANNRGWVVDNELIQQSGEIARNAKQNANRMKRLGKNIKVLSKAEIDTAKEMTKTIKVVTEGDIKKYDLVTQSQALLDAQQQAYAAIKATYKERLKVANQKIDDSLNKLKSKREKLKGG